MIEKTLPKTENPIILETTNPPAIEVKDIKANVEAPVTTNSGNKKTAFNLRALFLSIFFLILGAGLFYKYYEWQTLSQLIQLHNEHVVQEFKVDQELNEFDAQFTKKLIGEDEEETESDQNDNRDLDEIMDDTKVETNKAINELLADITIYEDKIIQYEKMIKDSQSANAQYQNRLNLLYGDKKTFAQQLISNRLAYYDNELDLTKDNMLFLHYLSNYLSLNKDGVALTFYLLKTQNLNDEEAINDYFSDIASLEKYSRDDFKFVDGDQIKAKYAYAYETLEKQKNYYKTMYLASKDVVNEDYESAAYKLSRISDDIADLKSIDMERITKEGQDVSKEIIKRQTENMLAKIELMQEFDQKKMGSYPMLQPIDNFKNDLSVCQLYRLKTQLFKYMKDADPEATDLSALMKELAIISPKTDSVDQSFNQDNIKYTSEDKNIKFECTDSDDGTIYQFTYQKEDQEDQEEQEETEE